MLLRWRAVSFRARGSRVYVGRRGQPPSTPDRHPVHAGIQPEIDRNSAVPTYTPKAGDTTRSWYVIDATDVVLGRLAVAAANLLRGKHKPTFTPNVDGGDFVIVINADKVAIGGDKLQKKFTYRHSGFPGGLRARALGDEMQKHADRVVEKAILGMIPHTKLGHQIQ